MLIFLFRDFIYIVIKIREKKMKLSLNIIQPSFCAHRKILIADDSRSMREDLTELVSDSKPPEDTFEINTASTIAEAQDSIINNKPDILLTDGNIDSFSSYNPDGLKLAVFASENGVKSIGMISGASNTLPKQDKKGF